MNHSKCHTFVGSNKVTYKDGVLSILCAACEKPIAFIPIASRTERFDQLLAQ
jgi:hypothetical protein